MSKYKYWVVSCFYEAQEKKRGFYSVIRADIEKLATAYYKSAIGH